MTTWADLYAQHKALRSDAQKNAVEGIRKALRELAARSSVLPQDIQSRFQPASNAQAGLTMYKLGWESNGEPLLLPKHPKYRDGAIALAEARLTILLDVDTAADHLHRMTIMLEGIREDESPLAVAVHLHDDRTYKENPDGDQAGSGACGHAALHCHVGPTLSLKPEIRVPFPVLTPGDAVAWVLSQVVSDFEPAPWPSVRDPRSRSSSLTR